MPSVVLVTVRRGMVASRLESQCRLRIVESAADSRLSQTERAVEVRSLDVVRACFGPIDLTRSLVVQGYDPPGNRPRPLLINRLGTEVPSRFAFLMSSEPEKSAQYILLTTAVSTAIACWVVRVLHC